MDNREVKRREELGELFIKHWIFRYNDCGSTRCMIWGVNMDSTFVKAWLESAKSNRIFFVKQSEQSDKEFYNLRDIRNGQKELALKMAEGLQEKYSEDNLQFRTKLEEIYADLQKDSADK